MKVFTDTDRAQVHATIDRLLGAGRLYTDYISIDRGTYGSGNWPFWPSGLDRPKEREQE